MNSSSPVARNSPLSMRTEPRGGSVLMETVLCLPLLLFLVTGIVQFSRIWEAKLLTRHAAYNAARAALVYRTSDYADTVGDDPKTRRIVFRRRGGPVWAAAVNTLAWKSATFDPSGTARDFLLPGFEGQPDFRVESSAFVRTRGADDRDPFGQVGIDPAKSWESNGLVKVSVRFKFPLLFSVFALGTVQGDPDRDGRFGTDDNPVPLVHDPDTKSRTRWSDGIPHIRLEESCILPKPWSTACYPQVSKAEAEHLEFVAP